MPLTTEELTECFFNNLPSYLAVKPVQYPIYAEALKSYSSAVARDAAIHITENDRRPPTVFRCRKVFQEIAVKITGQVSAKTQDWPNFDELKNKIINKFGFMGFQCWFGRLKDPEITGNTLKFNVPDFAENDCFVPGSWLADYIYEKFGYDFMMVVLAEYPQIKKIILKTKHKDKQLNAFTDYTIAETKAISESMGQPKNIGYLAFKPEIFSKLLAQELAIEKGYRKNKKGFRQRMIETTYQLEEIKSKNVDNT